MKQSTRFDAVLSHSGSSCRVFYLQSWDRNILYKVFDESAVLRAWLTPDSLRSGFAEYAEQGLISEFGGFKEREGDEKGEKVRCLYLLDAQMPDEESFTALLHRFLTKPLYADKFLLLSGTERSFPIGFEDDVVFIKIPYLEQDELEEIIRADYPSIGSKQRSMLCRELIGNTEQQIRRMLDIMSEYGYLNAYNGKNESECRAYIRKTREQFINRDGTLTIRHYDTDPGVEMPEYAAWIRRRKKVALEPAEAQLRGTDPLKGVIMIGLPGTGKTEAAKLTAYELQLPYVEFRLDELQNSAYGGSEERLRKYRDQINALPGGAVVVFDEIEKALGSSEGSRHEATNSLLGIFLKWMQETENVFFYLTCNSADKLPPELMRPGRLNARFMTFMPSREELRKIFLSHLCAKNKSTDGMFIVREQNEASSSDEISEKTINAIFDRLIDALLAGTDKKPDPFMTGADLKQLIEDTNILLWDRGLRMPYGQEAYTEALIECARESHPTGETAFPEILNTWRYARKNGVALVSGKNILSEDRDYDPFTGRFSHFTNECASPKTYDSWFEYRFKKYMNQSGENRY